MRQVILNFHGIGTPNHPLEDGEAPYWINEDLFAEILDMAARLKGQVKTDFTFDDGNLSDLTIGAEGLARHGWKAQIFVLTARIGQQGSLGKDDIRALQAAGHIIGLHGAGHVDWRGLDATGERHEYDTARETVAAITGQPVTRAAIPFGGYDRKVLQALRQRGFDRVYSSDGGTWRAEQYPIPRTSLRNDMSLTDIEAVLLDTPALPRRLRQTLAMTAKRWI